MGDAKRGNFVRRKRHQIGGAETDDPVRLRNEPRDRPQDRAFAGGVRPDDAHEFAL